MFHLLSPVIPSFILERDSTESSNVKKLPNSFLTLFQKQYCNIEYCLCFVIHANRFSISIKSSILIFNLASQFALDLEFSNVYDIFIIFEICGLLSVADPLKMFKLFALCAYGIRKEMFSHPKSQDSQSLSLTDLQMLALPWSKSSEQEHYNPSWSEWAVELQFGHVYRGGRWVLDFLVEILEIYDEEE